MSSNIDADHLPQQSWRDRLRSPLIACLSVLAAGLVFVGGVMLEAHVRGLYGRMIPVQVTGDSQAVVTAWAQPDFLWMGEMWSIDIQSDVPIVVDIDGKWKADVPPGEHSIYSNHDSENTTDYGPKGWWKTPVKVTVTDP